jgi:anti-sigma factor RsiW
MSCEDRALELNALIDGELPPKAEAGLLDHIPTCPSCAAELAGLMMLRARLAKLAPVEQPAEALTERIDRAITSQAAGRPRQRLILAGAGAGGLALAAAIFLMLLPRHDEAPTIRAVVDAALRQEIPQAAIVLADTRTGGADAWFSRHRLATPPVPDLTPAGFRFLGCRTDIVAGHRASILVYGDAGRLVTLEVWPAGGEAAHKVRSDVADRRAVAYWNNGRSEFWVSGADHSIVTRFTAAYRARA